MAMDTKPKVAILMLSWLRFNTMLETVSNLPKTCTSPLHLILRVQGAERLSEEERQQVYDSARFFHSTDIYFTRDNIGTAAARLDLTHRGAKQGYEYMMFTDDDIDFPEGGIDRQIEVLDTHPEIGSVSLKPGGIKKVQTVDENGVLLTTYDQVDTTLCEVYLIGSASIMFRSSLYTDHLVAPDPAYYIGTWDWDFVLQVRNVGYKVTVITDKKILNKRGGNEEYRQKRRNKRYVRENRKLFIEKWGFDPVRSRRTNSEFTKPVDVTRLLSKIEQKKFLEELEQELGPHRVEKVVRLNNDNIVIGTDWRSRMRANG